MNDDRFNAFVNELEREIIKKEIEDHSEQIVKLFRNPKNWGKPIREKYNFFQECKGEHGEMFQLFLKISKEDFIEEAHFLTDGCGCLVATGSQLTILIKGKTVKSAKKISPGEIDRALGGLPDHEKHCASFVITALNTLIANYKKSL